MLTTLFQGSLGFYADCARAQMQWVEFEPKPWEEDDIDIEISHCDIGSSDLHILSSGWSVNTLS